DLARTDPLLEEPHDRLPALVGELLAPRVDGRRRRATRQRHPQGLGRRRHRVGRVHARARALGGTGVALDTAELVVVDAPRVAGADGLEDVLDGDLPALPL